MVRKLTFAYPGDLDTLTGGYLYDKQILQGLEDQGWAVQRMSLCGAFPDADPAVLEQAARDLSKVDPSSPLVIDGLALGGMGEMARAFEQRGFIALVHHPLALESGISEQLARRLRETEAAALSHARHIIVTSPTTAHTLQSMFGIAPDNISVVVPGVERPAVAPEPAQHKNQRPVLLSVGSVIARKGYDVLVNALASLPDLDWELHIVGDTERDAPTAQSLRQQIDALGLQDQVTLLGSVDPHTLQAHYRQADLFVLASHYEGYGMAYAEAMQWGLAVIGTTGGAISQTVAPGCGLLVNPGDVEQLAQALRTLMTQPDLRAQMSHAALAHARQLPDWDDCARLFGQTVLKTCRQ